MEFISKTLRVIGAAVPSKLPRASGIGNRILKPIYKLFVGSGIKKFRIWDSIDIYADPTECIGGNLYFGSHIYDLHEREILHSLLKTDSVFVDIGANIGAYSLWASKKMGERGHIIAIEADPVTFGIISDNISENNIKCKVDLINQGVSDSHGELQFYRSTKNNAGGNSFFKSENSEAAISLAVVPLYDILKLKTPKVNVVKIDIEGFELCVLKKYFSDCETHCENLFPEYIMIEMEEGPLGKDEDHISNLKKLFDDFQYEVLFSGKNSVYKLKRLN